MDFVWSDDMMALRDRHEYSEERAIRARSIYHQREADIAHEFQESSKYC